MIAMPHARDRLIWSEIQATQGSSKYAKNTAKMIAMRMRRLKYSTTIPSDQRTTAAILRLARRKVESIERLARCDSWSGSSADRARNNLITAFRIAKEQEACAPRVRRPDSGACAVPTLGARSARGTIGTTRSLV